MASRDVAIDQLRGCVVALVVLHHAILAYVSFGSFNAAYYLRSTSPVVDDVRWAGFDLIVIFNDGFFMPLMFFLAGLFTWPSLERKGPGAFLRGRLARLGLPFLLIAGTLMPLAHYPSFKLTGATENFLGYWTKSATIGPWPTGPLWFVWYLLALSALAAGIFVLLPRRAREAIPTLGEALHRPSVLFPILIVLSLSAYSPLLIFYGRDLWFATGPFAIQASRVGLYLVYYGVAIVVGASAAAGAPWHGGFHRRWWMWSAASLVSFAALVFALTRGGPLRAAGPVIVSAAYAVAYTVFAATASLAAISIFGRFRRSQHRGLDSLGTNSYGIYLVHYVVIVWLQYLLLGLNVSAIAKGVAIFLIALYATWIAVAAARRNKVIARYL